MVGTFASFTGSAREDSSDSASSSEMLSRLLDLRCLLLIASVPATGVCTKPYMV